MNQNTVEILGYTNVFIYIRIYKYVCIYIFICIQSHFLENLQKGVIHDGVAEELKMVEKLY